jgi:hypothetical protein
LCDLNIGLDILLIFVSKMVGCWLTAVGTSTSVYAERHQLFFTSAVKDLDFRIRPEDL